MGESAGFGRLAQVQFRVMRLVTGTLICMNELSARSTRRGGLLVRVRTRGGQLVDSWPGPLERASREFAAGLELLFFSGQVGITGHHICHGKQDFLHAWLQYTSSRAASIGSKVSSKEPAANIG